MSNSQQTGHQIRTCFDAYKQMLSIFNYSILFFRLNLDETTTAINGG